jgi:hypothetical protein
VTADLVPPEATVESSIDAMALHFVRLELSKTLITKES